MPGASSTFIAPLIKPVLDKAALVWFTLGMRHTIVIEAPDTMAAADVEHVVTQAVNDCRWNTIEVVEYHREQVTEPAEEPETHLVETHGAHAIHAVHDGDAPFFEVHHQTLGVVGGAPDLQEARNLIEDMGGRLKRTSGKLKPTVESVTRALVEKNRRNV